MKSNEEQMIEDCQSALTVPVSRGGPGYSDWEVKFIESVADQVSDGELTQKQKDKLHELWDRI